MFYAINSMHDIAFRYGFNEEAGNFQNKNFNKAGKGKAKDAVYAVAQDALGSNGAMFMSKPDGQAPYMSVWTWQTTSPGRDGALVNDLVVHEYTHGISDRLIGGASTPNCLSTQEAKGLSEGWSDFFAAWMQMKASDNHDKITAIASYLGANDRPYSYSIHKERNPLTFGMANLADPMKRYVVGTIWGTMLYQIYWVFVDALKFTDKRETPDATKGNTRVFQLIIDSLAVTPCNPTFIQARDAILQSEKNNNSKDSFYCKLWAVFAFRGLGHSAGYDSNGKPIEKFDVHPSCTSKATA
ncbi:peptidase M36 [Syncephalis fuscata]|nr:peptidase M36 [Syncephalis fuscata]